MSYLQASCPFLQGFIFRPTLWIATGLKRVLRNMGMKSRGMNNDCMKDQAVPSQLSTTSETKQVPTQRIQRRPESAAGAVGANCA
jgi:hypothetical protein